MLERPIFRAGWTRVAFGDVVRRVNDKVDPWDSGLERYVAGEHMDTDDLPIRRWGLIGDDYLGPAFHMRFKRGHVLYGSRRTYLRKVALADFEGITANTTFVLETKDPAALMSELLPFLMQTEAFHSFSIKPLAPSPKARCQPRTSTIRTSKLLSSCCRRSRCRRG